MGTPASLLDLIARGGSIPGFNEAQQSQANTALTNAQVENVPLQGALMQAQAGQVGALTQEQQLKNEAMRRAMQDAEIYRQAVAASVAQGPEPTTTTGSAAAPEPVTTGPVSQPRRVDATAPPQSPITTPPFVPNHLQDPVGFAQYLASRGASGDFVARVLDSGLATRKAVLALSGEELAAEDARLVPVQRELEGVAQIPDGPQRQLAYIRARAAIERLDPDVASTLPPRLDNNALTMAIAQAGALKQHLDLAKTTQETATSAAQAGLDTASQRQKEAEAAQAEFDLNLLKGTVQPGAIEKRANDIAPAAEYPDINRQLQSDLRNATSRAAIQEAQNRASEKVAAATPEAMARKGKEAATVEAATLPYKERASRDLAQFSSGLEQNRHAAELAQSALEDYHTSDSAINGVQSLIANAVQNKNSVSASQVPGLAAAASLAMFNIKRLPATATKGMGNESEKALGTLQSITGGLPVSSTQLGELNDFLDVVKKSNEAKYNGTKQSIEQTYKGVKLPEVGSKALTATGPGGHKITSMDGGKSWVDAQTGAPVK